jgi:hypothetical protein
MQYDPATTLSKPPSCSRKETYNVQVPLQPVFLKHVTAFLEQPSRCSDALSLILVSLFVSRIRRTQMTLKLAGCTREIVLTLGWWLDQLASARIPRLWTDMRHLQKTWIECWTSSTDYCARSPHTTLWSDSSQSTLASQMKPTFATQKSKLVAEIRVEM